MAARRLIDIFIALAVAFSATVSSASGQSAGGSGGAAIAQLAAPTTRLDRIAFGSCLQQWRPQPIWSAIAAVQPQLMLMMGDNVYGDVKSPEMTELIDAYARQAQQPQFAEARRRLPMLAMWDDHDYGANEGGRSFPHRVAAAQLFHKFWRMEMSRAAIDGIHYSRTYGQQGQRVQIIMLDTRTLRSDLKRKTAAFPHWGAYEPDDDPAKTMLGEEQWEWLERQLMAPAEIRLLVSSVQVLAEGHGWERWGNLPRERERLLALLERVDARTTLLLSGNRHAGALYLAKRGRIDLVELTSSALNAPPRGPMQDARMPPLASELFIQENFGLIEIDWAFRRLDLSLRGVDGNRLVMHKIAF